MKPKEGDSTKTGRRNTRLKLGALQINKLISTADGKGKNSKVGPYSGGGGNAIYPGKTIKQKASWGTHMRKVVR